MSTGSVRSCPAPASGVVTSGTAILPSGLPPGVHEAPHWHRARAGTASCGQPCPVLDVEETDVLGVALDESPPGLHVLAHENAEELIGLSRVIQRHLTQNAAGRIHCGLPELAGVHLA